MTVDRKGRDLIGALRISVLLSSSLLISANAAMAAPDQPSMRDFRNQHTDLGRREARSLYRETFRNRSNRQSLNIQNPSSITQSARVEQIQNNFPTILNNDKRLFNNTLQAVPSSAKLVRLNSGVNLDLTSTEKNIVLGGNLFKDSQSVDIQVGSDKKTLVAGASVTAAEYIAVKQALSGSGQKLTVTTAGTANGGSVDLTEITANNDQLRASNLTIASGVTTYGDFGKRSDFTLLGDLNNYGSVYALSSVKSTKGGAIRAGDITNQQGALISTLPASVNAQDRLDLELNARGALSNQGDISASGNLTLAAGTSITNKGSVSAGDSVILYASSINNSSHIEARDGNVNIDGVDTAKLTVDNRQGLISALNGAINVRTPDYTGAFENNIGGGDLVSKELNLHAGASSNYVNVNQLTGVVSQDGAGGHVIAGTDNLMIGETCLTGDPTFFNTAGAITINGNLSAAEALTIIATGTITSQSGITIEARNATTGFDITMIAGANIVSTTGGSSSSTIPGGTAGSVTLDGTASATGGSIALSSMNILTSPTGDNGNGGNASFFAFKGSGAVSGRVDIDLATINTGGKGTGNNGNVVVVGGGTNSGALGSAIQLGNIVGFGGTGSGGNLTVITAQPQSSGGNIVYNADGSRAAGGQLVAGATLTADADIGFFGATTASASNATLRAGADIAEAGGARLFIFNFDGNVVLEAGDNIGTDSNDPFVITGFNTLFTKKVLKTLQPGNGTLSANADNVFIRRDATTSLNLTDSSANQFFLLKTGGALNVTGDITSNTGFVSLINTGGSLTVADNTNIAAANLIEVINASTKKVKPTLEIGTNAKLTTNSAIAGAGQIFVLMDPDAIAEQSLNKVPTITSQSNSGRSPTFAELKPLRPEQEAAIVTAILVGTGTITIKGKAFTSGNPLPTAKATNASISIANYKKGAMSIKTGVEISATAP